MNAIRNNFGFSFHLLKVVHKLFTIIVWFSISFFLTHSKRFSGYSQVYFVVIFGLQRGDTLDLLEQEFNLNNSYICSSYLTGNKLVLDYKVQSFNAV